MRYETLGEQIENYERIRDGGMITMSNKVWDVKTGETTDCFREGISGKCGLSCPVLRAGECDSEDEMMEDFPYEDLTDEYYKGLEDNKYYCPHCDRFFKPSEVKEQTDGISDTICPDCGKPLQEEGE